MEEMQMNSQAAAQPYVNAQMPAQKPGRRHAFWNDFLRPVLLMAVIMVLGELLGELIWQVLSSMVGFFVPSAVDEQFMDTAALYFPNLGIWLAGLLFISENRKDGHLVKTLWTSYPGNNVPNLLCGLLFGFVMNAACAAAAQLNGDIFLYYESAKPVRALLLFIAVFIQSSAEELTCRAYLYNKLMTGGKPAVAVIVNSLVFAALHLANPGINGLSLLNIFLSGVFSSLAMYKGRSFWFASAEHAAWNFTQNILLGLPNSGIVVPFSIFKLDASTAADSFFYNVNFGIEGSWMASVVLVIGCAVLLIMPKTVFASNREK